jgi:hypothetical protein
VSAFKPEQRHLMVRGRAFHFVSYEAQPANTRTGVEASPAMWYLMVEGRRCPALPCDTSLESPEIDRLLSEWATENAFGPAQRPERTAAPAKQAASQHPRNWWGP